MTVSSETSRKTFTGDGATTSFATSPIAFFESSNLTVYVVTTATGASTTLTENTHYTVSGGDGSTGTVSLAGGSSPYGAPSASQTLVIMRDLPVTQSVDLQNNEASDADVIEETLDRLTMIAQQLSTLIGRSFTLADSDVSGVSTTLPTPAASKLVGWNSGATALTNYASTAIVDTIVPTAFMETLLDDADAATARATLDAQQDVFTTRGDLVRAGASGVAERVALGTSGYFLKSDGTDAVWAALPTASTTAAGGIEIATAAEVVTATDTSRALTPGDAHNHPGVAKAWGYITHPTTVTESYPSAGVSVNNSGTGVYVVTHGRTMSSTTYPVVITPTDTTARVFSVTDKTTTAFTLTALSDGGAAEDLSAISYAVFGTLA